MFKFAVVGSMSIAAVTPLCAGTVTYVSQERTVSAYGEGLASDSAEAQDFGHFEAAVGSFYPPFRMFEEVNGYELSVITTASQTSTLTPTSIDVSGSILGGQSSASYSPSSGFLRVDYLGSAESLHTITFTVDVPTHYTLDATWFHGSGDGGADFIQYDEPARIAYVDFTGPGVHHRSEFVRDNIIMTAMTHTLDAEGVLQPGEYTLDIRFEWNSQPYSLYAEAPTPMTFDTNMTFSTVPAAPTSAVMFLGLVTAARRKRR